MTNHELESCKRDIEIIRSTIERSKVNLTGIAPLFIIYGLTVFLFNLSLDAVCYYTFFVHAIEPPHILLHIHLWSRYLLLIVLFVLFCRRYKITKASDNPYALQLMRIWGIAMYLPPVLTLLRNIFVEVCGKANLIGLQIVMLELVDLAEIFAFLFALLFTGIILNHKLLTASSLLLLPTMFMILFWQSSGCVLAEASEVAVFIGSRIGHCNYVVMLGYALLGIYFLCTRHQKE